METEINNNSIYYRYSEKGIKEKNYKLWEIISIYSKEDIPFKEKFYLYENSLELKPKCYCGNDVKFLNMNNGFRRFCSIRCTSNNDDIKNKKKLTNIEKYGVDNPSKSKLIKEKVKETNNIKFGVDYPLQSADVLNKSKNIFIEKYGVDNPSKIREVREKAENTMMERFGSKHAMRSEQIKSDLKVFFIEKYGVDNPSKIREIREKAESTMIERFGVRSALQNTELLNKLKTTNLLKYGSKSFTSTEMYKNIMIKYIFDKNSKMVNDDRYIMIKSDITEYLIKCNKCNSEFIIQRQLWRNRIKNNEDICLVCNPIFNGVSIGEKNIVSYIKEIYNGEIIENFRYDRKEIDIYLPELKIGFEYNGLYWHSELNKNKNYHYDKLLFFNNLGINLIQVWEDDWKYKQDIIKSMINNKILKSERIFARKCEIKEIVDNKLIRDFLEENHIQGFVGSNIKLGLFFNNELVSLMTFGNLRKSLGQVSKKGVYELLRFCNKINISVIGGASKLFKFFIKNYKVEEVISYSLNSYSDGNLYKNIGFNLENNTDINYFWCKNGIKYHRFNFRKDKLVKEGYDVTKTESEIMYERGYFKVFDCGSKKWIYKIIIKKTDLLN